MPDGEIVEIGEIFGELDLGCRLISSDLYNYAFQLVKYFVLWKLETT